MGGERWEEKAAKPAGPGRLGRQVRQAGTLWVITPPPFWSAPYGSSGLSVLNGLGHWPLALSGLGLGLGQVGRAARGKGHAQWQGSAANVPSKISLSPGGRQRKIDSGEHPKIEALHCYLVWVYAHKPSPSSSPSATLLPLNLATLPTGSAHARRCRAPFPSRCLLVLLASWLAAAQVCVVPPHALHSTPWPTIHYLPISLPRHRRLYSVLRQGGLATLARLVGGQQCRMSSATICVGTVQLAARIRLSDSATD